jgi:hypothetical protein
MSPCGSHVDGMAHMLRRLRVKLHGRGMMFRHVRRIYA